MQIRLFIFVLSVSLLSGCSTEHFITGHGDVGQFILQKTIGYGGRPTTTIGLPIITTHWRYLEDGRGTIKIYLPHGDYSSIESFLNMAFAGMPQFGPKVSADGSCRIHEYRMSSKGGGVQLTGHDSDTLVIIQSP